MQYLHETVHDYAAYRDWVRSFCADGGLNLLIVIGPPGIAKSQIMKEMLPPNALYRSGATRTFQLYINVFQHRDQPVVIDDVDALFKDTASVNLLKCLGNTDAVKELFWGKRAKQLEEEGVPRRYRTTSRVCILANTLKAIEENLNAVLDRAFVIHFKPTVAEVHREVGKWLGTTTSTSSSASTSTSSPARPCACTRRQPN